MEISLPLLMQTIFSVCEEPRKDPLFRSIVPFPDRLSLPCSGPVYVIYRLFSAIPGKVLLPLITRLSQLWSIS